MNRAVLLAAGLLTLAACSSSGEAELPPPLDTEAPSTTIEAPTTTEAPATTSTSTTLAETTTTVTTTTVTTTREPEITNPPADLEAAYAAVFDDYAEAWVAKRMAFRDPSNTGLRAPLSQFYSGNQLSGVIETLDRQVSENSLSVDRGDDSQRVTLIAGISFVESASALIVICEVLTDSIVSSLDATVEYEGSDAFTNQVFLEWNEDRWVVANETSDKVESGTECS